MAVLSTGDEVVEPSTQTLGPGQIRDANRSMLLAACSTAGAETLDLGVARDTEGAVEACFSRAVQEGTDVLITSGLLFALNPIPTCASDSVFGMLSLTSYVLLWGVNMGAVR